MPFAAQFRGEQDVVDVGELVRPLVSVHRLVLFLPDMYRLLDPSVHSVAFSVDDLGLILIAIFLKSRLNSTVSIGFREDSVGIL